MSSNISGNVVSALNALNQEAKADGIASAGDSQASWPDAGVHAMVIRKMNINGEGTFYPKKGIRIPCIDIDFVLETLPNASDPTFNPDTFTPCVFTSKECQIVPKEHLTGDLSKGDSGPGWRVKDARERLKAYIAAIVPDYASMDYGAQIITLSDMINNDDGESVVVQVEIDVYNKKDDDGNITKVYKTDYCLGRIDAPAAV